ncbi:type IV secretory system conjugative DNA transfer family protein [Leucobacter sp. G161]|uniref:type IV secretory system conjugative DNA transfer family protein n=1 Tax=Leucobacter sp. G161 TaxID=663704 RepID=UPI00073B50F0|nr:hypothetical protein [Leucobacter sp. G161]KUF08439.1 hypothetical protein AUL38_04605 [Leucobacter sp. G161]
MLFKNQADLDAKRDSYRITFPADITVDRIQAYLRTAAGAVSHGTSGFFFPVRSSMVFEVMATPTGITHRLIVPRSEAEHLTSQLRTHGRGITMALEESREEVDWNAGSEVSMTRPLSQLRVGKDEEVSASILGAMQPLQDDEMMLLQWVISPTTFERLPSKQENFNSRASLTKALLNGVQSPSNDEIGDRRAKLSEQNFLAVGRVLAKSPDPVQATRLVRRLESALSSVNTASSQLRFKARGARLKDESNKASTPLTFPAQLNIVELSSLLAWPVGKQFIPGLTRGSSRQLFATAEVSSEGRVLGTSTYSGHERPIALPYRYATRHMVVSGSSGTGKTAFLVNCFAQDVQKGYGAIVMDAGDSQSDETMFSGALNSIPPHRVNDVIVINVANESSSPVGFNIFEQTDPRTIADQMVHLFQGLFNDISGVWLPQLLYHGVYTLAAHGGLSFVDLSTLLYPQTPEEKEWANYVINNVKDPNIRGWWTRWQAMDLSKQQTRLEPLYNRIWQVLSRPEIINIIGQSKSTFSIQQALKDNKILLINLAGLSPDTAKIIGTLFMNAIWTSARRIKSPEPNYLYLDEFQVMTSNLSVNLDDLLSRARKHNLGLAMATQYFQEGVPREVRNAAVNNALTKVIFRVSSEEARLWNAEFDRDLDSRDFKNLGNYEAYVRVASESGVADVSLKTLPPQVSLGTSKAVRDSSRATYGRPLVDVVAEREQRRTAPKTSIKKKRPPIGVEEW